MPAQQGCFTMCEQILAGHECIIGELGAENLWQLTIPANQKPDFLLRLREMNITASTLFPGVDGLAESVGELVVLGSQLSRDVRVRHIRQATSTPPASTA